MKIAIDASRVVNEKAGVGRYSQNLIRSLIKMDDVKYLLICNFFRGKKTKLPQMESFRQKNVQIKYLKMPGKIKEKIWHSKRLTIAQKYLADSNVYLALTFLDVITNLKIPQAVVIHDLSTFKYPGHLGEKVSSYFNRQTIFACKHAQKIIAISQSTKKDLIDILKIPENKIEVVYPGLNSFPKPVANLPAGLKKKSYILTVGTIEPRKNLAGLIGAYALLPPKLSEQYPLVIVGGKGWNNDEIYELVRGLNLEAKIKFLGYVPDRTLAKLYQDASLFVYPSLYEGFGLPVLEAQSFGTPVITSNVSSLPEVAANNGILVDPKNLPALSSAIHNLLENKTLSQESSQKGIKQAKKFSYDNAAYQIFQILKSLLK